MARSDIKTWLSLDEFSQIIGLDPLGFNGLHSNTLQRNTVCGDVFFSYDWQHSDRLGRDTIAMTIQQAEQEIAREVGYNLLPDWTYDERLEYPKPSTPEAYNLYGVNVRFMSKSVEVLRGHVISGGTRAKTLIQANAVVVRTDTDGDGYAETCTVTVPITITDTNEVHVYYPNHSGEDGWEVRPIKIAISGGFATITFKVWQIPVDTSMDSLDAQPLDADLIASYETLVDVYRVYNDPSTQVQFMWEGTSDCCGTCNACQFGTQTGCFHTRDPRMGFVVPSPASWDAATSEFVASEYSACREPDQVRLWYYSGWRNMSLSRPYVELDPYWKYAIAYFAASKFERPVCGCSNVNQFIEKWRRDAAFASESEGGFTVTTELAANRLGTSMGALYAYRRIQQNGVKVNK
jgi:hypothetical protein